MPIAEHAVRAAKNWIAWGWWAALRYAIKRRVPMPLLNLALKLEWLRRKK